jgi:putative glutamine amidotransferase
MKQQITIGITDCGSYANYDRWMLKEPGVKTIKLSYKDNNLDEIRKCDGVILSGGEDVHPRFYNKTEYIAYCDEIDERRDEFEWKVLDYTEANNVPVLGICRGLQVANVYFGGTLIPDIPSFGRYNHSRFPEEDRYHEISVDPNSLLCKIVENVVGEINSSHHQSAELIGKGLVVNSFSPDGIVEGMERRTSEGKPWLMLVQWHPERMRPQDSAFTSNVKESFVEAVRKINSVYENH